VAGKGRSDFTMGFFIALRFCIIGAHRHGFRRSVRVRSFIFGGAGLPKAAEPNGPLLSIFDGASRGWEPSAG
jgi:hypothetical protein